MSDPVIKVGLKSMDPAKLVMGEPLLARTALIRGLASSANDVLAGSEVRRVAPGGEVFAPREDADVVYLIARGGVALLPSAAADAIPVVTLQVGDVFGAAAALGESKRNMAARTTTETDLVVFPAARLESEARTRPPVKAALEDAKSRCEKAAGEMEDFLDRW